MPLRVSPEPEPARSAVWTDAGSEEGKTARRRAAAASELRRKERSDEQRGKAPPVPQEEEVRGAPDAKSKQGHVRAGQGLRCVHVGAVCGLCPPNGWFRDPVRH